MQILSREAAHVTLISLQFKNYIISVMENIQEYYKVVESALSDIGVDPETCRDEGQEGSWTISSGNIFLLMDCWQDMEQNVVVFQVLSPLFDLPEEMPAEFYNEILELNFLINGTSFTKLNKTLVFKSICDLELTDKTEVNAMINRVGFYADKYGENLSMKYFGVSRSGDAENPTQE